MINFLTGPWGAILGKFALVLALGGAIWFAVGKYNDAIRDGERLRFENAQYAQNIKDMKDLDETLKKLENVNTAILVALDTKNEKATENHTKVVNYITSPEAQKENKEASPIIKNTIRILRDEQ